MTLPYERRWAINNTKQFLIDIGTNESLPEEVRKEAWRNLHYQVSTTWKKQEWQHLNYLATGRI